MGLSESEKQRIESMIGSGDVVLFMKGNRMSPQCGFSARVVQMLDTSPLSPEALEAEALQETQDGITQVLETSRPVELTPQTAYIRRMQHQLAEEYGLTTRSYGKEPNRRVKIFAPDA